ncbi:tRNA (guanosine(37)-N1)-methyltransferase TrmD [Klenkia sp. LSe6-5]|uniref:tRNA (guanine-N(1)-)-methyltransferase n=1 Tax=Klenkia sesuvii TaxID=3103137 RepID=A0ABU8DV77_9ACTN
MRIDVLTIFPEYLAPLGQALLGKAAAKGLVEIGVHDLRTWTDDVHRTVDDSPYGGGPGMVMRPEPWGRALAEVRRPGTRLVVPTPAGRPFTQTVAAQWATEPGLVFACGRYEGIDQRVADDAAAHGPVSEVSIGDYVLAGGESAVLVMVEAVTRLIPGVVGNAESVEFDSHADGLLEGPSYTRPASWRGHDVPPVLLSGDHAAIARWRRAESVRRTADRRPDLLAGVQLTAADRAALDADA